MADDRIYLVGFMGAGKTTVGKLLAERLGGSFIDLDSEIEKAEGKTVAKIFAESGEAHFRGLERVHLRLASAEPRTVIALGGGAYIDAANREYVEEHGCSVHLEASLSSVGERMEADGSRPLFSDPHRLADLYRQRLPSYRMARVAVRTDGVEPEEIVELILEDVDWP